MPPAAATPLLRSPHQKSIHSFSGRRWSASHVAGMAVALGSEGMEPHRGRGSQGACIQDSGAFMWTIPNLHLQAQSLHSCSHLPFFYKPLPAPTHMRKCFPRPNLTLRIPGAGTARMSGRGGLAGPGGSASAPLARSFLMVEDGVGFGHRLLPPTAESCSSAPLRHPCSHMHVCLDIPGVGLAHCKPVWPYLLKRNAHTSPEQKSHRGTEVYT